jgi:hypothetical protein
MDGPVVIFWLSCRQLLMFHNTGKHIETPRQKLHTAYKDLYGWNAEKRDIPGAFIWMKWTKKRHFWSIFYIYL